MLFFPFKYLLILKKFLLMCILFYFEDMAEQNTVDIVIYFGGQQINSNGSVSYDRPSLGFMQISRSTTFAELELILYEEIDMDRNNFKLHIFFKYIHLSLAKGMRCCWQLRRIMICNFF